MEFDNEGRAYIDGGGDSSDVVYVMDRMNIIVYQDAHDHFVLVGRDGRTYRWIDWATEKYDCELRWMGTGSPVHSNVACRASIFRKIEGCAFDF